MRGLGGVWTTSCLCYFPILYVRSPAAFLDDSISSPPLLPRMLTKPRTVCGGQPVAFIISAKRMAALLVHSSCQIQRPSARTWPGTRPGTGYGELSNKKEKSIRPMVGLMRSLALINFARGRAGIKKTAIPRKTSYPLRNGIASAVSGQVGLNSRRMSIVSQPKRVSRCD